MTDTKFRQMAAYMGRTVGETASEQRIAGYSEQDIAKWRQRKDREDDEFMRVAA